MIIIYDESTDLPDAVWNVVNCKPEEIIDIGLLAEDREQRAFEADLMRYLDDVRSKVRESMLIAPRNIRRDYRALRR